MKTITRFWKYLAQFFLEWKIFQRKAVDNIGTHILCSTPCFQKMCLLWVNVEKYRRAEQATDDPMEPAHCMLDT
jgi:hypothetical protein